MEFKRKFLVTILSMTVSFGLTFNITKGWNLLGTENNITNLNQLIYQGIEYIWAYDNNNKKWKLYTDKNLSIINDFEKLTYIPAKTGFWIYSDDNKNINTLYYDKKVYKNCTQFFYNHENVYKALVKVSINGYMTDVICTKTKEGNITSLYTLNKEFGFQYEGKPINAKYKIYEQNLTNYKYTFVCPKGQTPQFMSEKVWWQGGWCTGEDRKNRVMCRDSKIFDDCYCCDENTSINGCGPTIIYGYAKLEVFEK